MRDLAVTAVIFGLLPVALMHPHWGILLWTWVGLMSPHRLAFGFANSLNFSLIIAIVTIVAILVSREPKRLPLVPPVIVLIIFCAWMVVTTSVAFFPELAWPQLEKVAKIQLFIFLTILVMQTRKRIEALVWVCALSLAFYGVKGGIFTLVTGGQSRLSGPEAGFIGGNTEISLALTMTVPLLRWLQLQTQNRWLRWGLGVSMVLVAIAVLGSYSRGGFLAIAAMSVWLWFKTRNKLAVAVIFAVLVPILIGAMPDKWWDRMVGIQDYEQDTSSMSRLTTWGFAWNLALANPVTGGGLETFQPHAFAIWAPDAVRSFDAHSIWFKVLAEHGFVGLALFAMVWLFSWRTANQIIRDTRGREDHRWATDLAAMIQVSLIGYWVGGTFLSLPYWDFPYILVALLVVTRVVVQRALEPEQERSGLRHDSNVAAPVARAEKTEHPFEAG